MNNLELADNLQATASNHYGDLCGMLWDAGAALRKLHTENMAFRCTEMAPRDELEALKRAISDAEPVAYIHRQGNFYEVAERLLSQDEKDRGWSEEPLYTHPAPQAKPLLFSEIWDNDAIMEVNADARLSFDLIERFVRAIEAAHNIGEKK